MAMTMTMTMTMMMMMMLMMSMMMMMVMLMSIMMMLMMPMMWMMMMWTAPFPLRAGNVFRTPPLAFSTPNIITSLRSMNHIDFPHLIGLFFY